jgi:hypothetical protein
MLRQENQAMAMRRETGLFLVAVVVVILGLRSAQAYEIPQAPANAMKLTAADYMEIQQLVARYPYALDHCTHGGYDYADLYVDDGMFAAATRWGTTSDDQRTYVARGRRALAIAAGGAADGKCLPPEYNRGYGATHLLTNVLITATPTGAVGMSRLLVAGVCSYPHTLELQSGYEDVYVKTAKGWRFKSRIHVLDPGHTLQFGACDGR